MEEDRKLLVGIDLGKEVTQMHCFDFTSYEPVPIGRKVQGERVYEIPTALAVNPERGEWYWVDEEYAKRDGVICLHYLLADVMREEIITVGRYSVESYQVLKRFIVKVLSLLKEYYPAEMIRKLVITVSKKEDRLTGYLIRICEEIGIPKNGMVVQNYRQSYMYYAISQPKELWNNNVGLFELNQNTLIYTQINIDRKTIPYIIGAASRDISDGIDWEGLERDGDSHISYAFINAANTALHKQLVTTVYVTGKGFEKSWANHALQECLCRNLAKVGITDIEEAGEANGSTDVGNVSHVCPTIHPSWNIMAPGEVYSTHTVEFREATLRQPAKDALMVNVCAMAMAGKEILDDPELLAEIKREFAEAVAND